VTGFYEDVGDFWVVTPCRLVGRYQRFGETYYLHGVATQNIVILTAFRTSNLTVFVKTLT
jgi:hypothetical protein